MMMMLAAMKMNKIILTIKKMIMKQIKEKRDMMIILIEKMINYTAMIKSS